MNQVARLTAERHSQLFQPGFETLGTPILQRLVSLAQVPQPIEHTRFFQSFFNTFRIVRIFLGEKVIDPLRDIPEQLDFLFHDLQDAQQVSFIVNNDACFPNKWLAQFAKSVEWHLNDVLSIQPITLVQVKGRVTPIDCG